MNNGINYINRFFLPSHHWLMIFNTCTSSQFTFVCLDRFLIVMIILNESEKKKKNNNGGNLLMVKSCEFISTKVKTIASSIFWSVMHSYDNYCISMVNLR